MPNFTNHSKRRMKQRCGAGAKTAEILAKRAYSEGIKHSEARGELKKWMDREYLAHGTDDCRFYANKLYIFRKKDSLLITVLDAPLYLEQNIADFVDVKTYLTYKRNRIKRKRNPELKKALINDIQSRINNKINAYLKESNSDYSFLYIDENYKIVFTTSKKLNDTIDMQHQISYYIKEAYGLESTFQRIKKVAV